MSTFPRMHVSLYVHNIEKTVAFYNTFFGVDALKVKPGYAKYVLESPSLIISFVENPDKVQERFGHLGFQVEKVEEVMQKLESIKNAGLEVREEMGVSCCYAVQDKFWVSDPDGHQWEIYYFHQDAEFNDPHYQFQEEGACCMPTQLTKEGACCSPEDKQKVKLSDLKKTCC